MKPSSHGFTLLELMVAIAIFGIISTAAYKLFLTVTRAQEVSHSVLDELDKLQRAEVILEKDFIQVVRRSVRDNQGLAQPALKAPGLNGSIIEFARAGWDNPLQSTRSTLQRVSYSVEDQTLIRYYWSMLDRAPDALPIRQEVLAGIQSARLRFLDNNKRWVSQWPVNSQLMVGSQPDDLSQIPVAIELTLVHETMGSMISLIPLSTYKPDQRNVGQQNTATDSDAASRQLQGEVNGY